MAEGEWYYCLDHQRVEPYEGCRSLSRLGPYPTAGAAARALERVNERNEEWENDPRYADPDDEDDKGSDRDWSSFRP